MRRPLLLCLLALGCPRSGSTDASATSKAPTQDDAAQKAEPSSSAEADAKKKAEQAHDIAKAIEDQIDKFTSMTVSGKDDLDKIMQDGEDLKSLITSDPFADGPGPPGPPQDDPAKAFPGNRKTKGKAEKIDKAERLEVEDNHKWDEARDAPVVPPDDDDDGDDDADGGSNA